MFEIAAELPEITDLPPWADAGEDVEIELPGRAALLCEVGDDWIGRKRWWSRSSLSSWWMVVDGPAWVRFTDRTAPRTVATFRSPGGVHPAPDRHRR